MPTLSASAGVSRPPPEARTIPLLKIRDPAGVMRCRATAWDRRCMRGRLIGVRVVVTQIARDESLCRRMLDTAGLPDAGRRESLIEQVLAVPPPYRAAPGRPVCVIDTGDRAIVFVRQVCQQLAQRPGYPAPQPPFQRAIDGGRQFAVTAYIGGSRAMAANQPQLLSVIGTGLPRSS